jgi:hypothetical protein
MNPPRFEAVHAQKIGREGSDKLNLNQSDQHENPGQSYEFYADFLSYPNISLLRPLPGGCGYLR